MRLWFFATDDRGNQEAYRLVLTSLSTAGRAFRLVKHSDGTAYDLEQRGQELHCDCPGATAHGPTCAEGKGCKHARMIRAARLLLGK